MVSRNQWDTARAMLARGKPQREIQRVTGLSRKTISRIGAGQLRRPSPCQGCKPVRPTLGRCPTCGAKVELPCCACCPEVARSGPRPIGEVLEELTLDLRPAEARRREQLLADRSSRPPDA